MSFIDPDLRDKWAKEAEIKRQHCKSVGHVWSETVGPCQHCGAEHPDFRKPRVTLVTDNHRAIFNPANQNIIIERKGFDSLGAARWEKICEITSQSPRDNPSNYPIWELLSKGKVP